MSVDLKDKAISVEVFKFFFDYLNSKKVSKETKVNNHTLEGDVTLVPSDIGAIPDNDGSIDLRHIKNQGTSNSGKFLSVGADGSVSWGDVNLDSVGALSTKGGTMTGALSTVDPTEDSHAANKGYVDGEIGKVSEEVSNVSNKVVGMLASVTVTLLSSNWENNLQTVPVDGVTSDSVSTDVLASPAPDDAIYSAYTENNIRLYAQMDNAVQFKCDSIPPIDLNVNLMIRK